MTLAERASTRSPLPLLTGTDAAVAGVRLSSRSWLRIRPNVYVDRDPYGSLVNWQRYALRVHAFLRTHPNAVLCLESAAVVLGLPLFGETRDIHVLADQGEKSRRFGDVCVHASNDSRPVAERDGILTTDLLATALDLTSVLPPAKAVTVADAALSRFQGGLLQRSAIDDSLASAGGRRGVKRARWAWANADERSESPGESISRMVMAWSGYEIPELQPEFRYEGHLDRGDFLFSSNGTIGEADGWGKYALDDPEIAARRLTEEKRREDRLRRHGHPIARWDLSDALRIEPLCRALSAAGVRPARPTQSHLLATMTASPREIPFRSRTRRSDPQHG